MFEKIKIILDFFALHLQQFQKNISFWLPWFIVLNAIEAETTVFMIYQNCSKKKLLQFKLLIRCMQKRNLFLNMSRIIFENVTKFKVTPPKPR